MKPCLITFLFALIATTAIRAQDPTILSQYSFGGSSHDACISTVNTLDGGYIMAGSSMSPISGVKTENNIGEQDFWIIKVDSDFTIEWQNTIGGTDTDVARNIIATNDGGYIVAGSSLSDSSSDKAEDNIGIGPDYWVMKLDATGAIIWENTIGGDGIDSLDELIPANDGGYILAGYSYSDISGDKTENSIGAGWESDFWLVKINDDGEVLWDKTIGGDASDSLFDINSTANGYILGGWSRSNISGDKTEDNIGELDYWVVKTDNFGNVIWDNTIGGTDRDRLSTITPTNDGGYMIVGSSESNISADKTENNIGDNDYWVVKLNEFGAIEWDNTIGGSGYDIGGMFIEVNANKYIVTGYSESNISGDKLEDSYGPGDIWLLSLNAQGEIMDQNTIGGSGSDSSTAIQIEPSDTILLTGNSSSDISGDKTTINYGNLDFWIIRLSDVIGWSLGTTEYDFLSPSIYPNPILQEAYITHQEIINEISVFDNSGKIIEQLLPNEKSLKLDTSKWSSGFYLIKVKIGDKTYSKKIIKK